MSISEGGNPDTRNLSFELRKINDKQFSFLTNYLSSKYGLRIPPEKKIWLESRLLGRLNALNLPTIGDYIHHVFKTDKGSVEYQFFIDHVTTHKTFFFRENYQFEFLKTILPQFAKPGHPVNIWSAGCSTGEEVYTLGMVLNEKRSDLPSMDYKIYGTDISVPSLKMAARGVFSLAELENIPEHLVSKYFRNIEKPKGPRIQFNYPEITRKINLGVLNLNSSHYNLPTTFDFVFCRNVTIYFDHKTRQEVLERIVSKLRPGGYLFLGHSETALGTTLPLKSIQPTIYQKIA